MAGEESDLQIMRDSVERHLDLMKNLIAVFNALARGKAASDLDRVVASLQRVLDVLGALAKE